jgi:hypothetical protein
MDAVAKGSPQKIAGSKICAHHWVIEPANEPTSKGICKLCGCEREFVNFLKDLRSTGTGQKSEEKPLLDEM